MSSLFDLDELDFFDLTDGFDFSDSLDIQPQSELLCDVDSRIFRIFLARRSRLDLLFSLDGSDFDGSDDGGEGRITSILGSFFLTYSTFYVSRLTVIATNLAIGNMSFSLFVNSPGIIDITSGCATIWTVASLTILNTSLWLT